MYDYFFSGPYYIVVQRDEVGPGQILEEYPKPITALGWGAFGADGIDAALYSGSKCYFFDHTEYIRVTANGGLDLGTVDPGFPRPISDWGWPSTFGARGIDAALWSGSVCFFFSGDQYIRVRRGDSDFGIIDPFYPKPISQGWDFDSYPALSLFNTNSIDAAFYSGSKCFLFSGTNYVQVSKGDLEPGLFDPPGVRNISDWRWADFGQNGIDAALNNDGPLSPEPSGGLRSNLNYFLHDNGNPLTNVTISLALDQGLLSEANGWSVQLNCYSQQTPSTITEWQQYVIFLNDSNNVISARIDNWRDVNTELIRADTTLITLDPTSVASETGLVGSSMSFTLNTDSNNNVTGCTYSITTEGSSTFPTAPGLISPVTHSVTLDITSVSNLAGLPPITSAELAPIVAMQLNIVGEFGLQFAEFNTTSGTVTYSTGQPLASMTTEPSFTVFNDNTGETSNMLYGPLPVATNKKLTQSFYVPVEVTTGPDATAARQKELKATKGHALPIPLSVEVERALKESGSELQLPLPLHLRDPKDRNVGMLVLPFPRKLFSCGTYKD